MRVLVAVEGTRGDVHPMLALARTMIRAGHDVRLCAPPDFEDEVVATGAAFVSLGTPVRRFLDEGARAVHGGAFAMLREMVRWGRLSVDAQFRVLPAAARTVDLVLGAGTIVAGASAAELAHVPYRAVLYTPAVLPSADHTPCILPLQLRSPWINRALWRSTLLSLALGLRPAVNRRRRVLGLGPVRDLMGHILSPRPILAVDRALAPAPADAPRPVEQIRCLHPLEGGPLPPKLESFLDRGPAPIYLGFGSMTDPDPGATTRRLLEAVEAAGCRAVLSRGWAGLGEGPLPETVIAIDAVDHATLFPRMAAIVHHGGAGTTHTAARAGVPQLIVPHVLDQYYFARRVSDLGIGLAAPSPRRLDTARWFDSLRAVLDNEWMAGRARDFAQELSALGPVEPALERVLDV